MNGALPALGAGTFRLEGDTAYQSVAMALEAGYRHIDTAQIYGNEQEVGDALRDSGVARDELFVTTKVWMDRLSPAKFLDSVKESLEKLQTPYVDLLLIHWPLTDDSVPMADYLTCLKQAQTLGLTRHIGVSNFTVAQMEQAIAILGEGALLTNQVEVHPFLQNNAVVEFCHQHQVTVTGYMPLAVGDVFKEPVLQQIAERHQSNPAAVALAWIRQRGLPTIPSSTKRANLEANLASLQLTLSEDEMAQIATLDRNQRIANPDFAPNWD
ncbi:2,5-didehydrogluconate reductase DkgB [Ferrimonas marina]|uniref:2,5-diketo-D-gluconate reductase B n=1 Tax=Ferrimonas marina TaxID=299255 RepID=A0A1M5YTF0_9GAMM|nr:2,5-didehydrogluconate reductase DkgB [Ferrimonas marina]SHI15331.1 2,5-diketo-D-gluconate reductase B [Ferrimonas marina]